MTSRVASRKTRATVATAGATPTMVTQITLAADGSFHCDAKIVAKDAAGNSKIFELVACVKRVSGTASLVGASTAVFVAIGDAGLATATAAIDVSGDNVRVMGTGIAATNIDWLAELEILEN